MREVTALVGSQKGSGRSNVVPLWPCRGTGLRSVPGTRTYMPTLVKTMKVDRLKTPTRSSSSKFRVELLEGHGVLSRIGVHITANLAQLILRVRRRVVSCHSLSVDAVHLRHRLDACRMLQVQVAIVKSPRFRPSALPPSLPESTNMRTPQMRGCRTPSFYPPETCQSR